MTTTSLEPDSITEGQVIPLAARARHTLPTPRQVQATMDALCPAMARGEGLTGLDGAALTGGGGAA